MLSFIIILIILKVLIVLLMFVPTLLGVDYLQEESVRKLRIRMRLLGISFSIPISLDKKNEKPKKKDSENKKTMTPKRFIAFSKRLYAAYREIEVDFKELFSELKKRFSCREISLSLQYGTKNPATTGILNGAVWTASSLILKVLDSILGVTKKKLDIQPVFTKPCMCLHFKCTFGFKLADALRFALKINQLVKIIKHHIGELPEEAEEVL